MASEYDFIVVGAGTAGCVLAARLSEDESSRVLLIEAGGAQHLPEQSVPPAWPTLLQGRSSWGEFTVPQAATNSVTLLPRGRGLGGSSAINAMVFARGHRSSYDRWPGEGAEGWGYGDLLPYFKRTETAAGRDSVLRGASGPLEVGPASPPNAVIAACLRAAEEAGHRRAADISSGMEEGFGLPDLNIVAGRRQSAADAYLEPALERPNLTVVTDAVVQWLRIERGRCTGVEYSTASSARQARTSGEVVLAAGSIGSAKLLMLSGIGPYEHLQKVGVPALLDLPGVGANLHDHPIVNVVYAPTQPVPERHNNHGEAIGLLRSGGAADSPDLQVVCVDAPTHLPSVQGPRDGYTLAVSVIRPYSRGTVRLSGRDPMAPPLLDPNYFSDERDMAAAIAGVRLVREIGRQPGLDAWRGQEVLPGPDVEDDASLRAYINRSLASYCHPVGTCRIGGDRASVVDTDLRVHGITGLRVADASVMPSIPSANTNATVYAIAERAAELLRSAA